MAMLADKNYDVNTIKTSILNKISGDSTKYQSIDSVIKQDEVVNYLSEFLNSLDLPDMPPHQ